MPVTALAPRWDEMTGLVHNCALDHAFVSLLQIA
jgi:hypothetical protein